MASRLVWGLVGLLGCGNGSTLPEIPKTRQREHSVQIELLPPPSAQQLSLDFEPKCETDTSFVPYKNDEEINAIRKAFIDRNYRRIAAEQKRKFRLNKYHTPKYSYHNVLSDSLFVGTGLYDRNTQKIEFYLSNSIKKLEDGEYLFESYNCMGISPDEVQAGTDYTIRHELGHAYFYAMAKKLGKSIWLSRDDEGGYNNKKNVPDNLVSEGFGEYMAIRGTPFPVNKYACDVKEMENFPPDYSYVFDYDLYACGFTFVSAILDKDFQKGLNYLLTHPLTETDLSNLITWQTNALKEMDK